MDPARPAEEDREKLSAGIGSARRGAAPTLVIGRTNDDAVPRHHFDALLHGIPNAEGSLMAQTTR